MKKKVCVTGGSSYIGSWLVKKLLLKGYFVHATLRNLDDTIKVGALKSLPGAESGLKLFKADIYDPDEFGQAIQGCDYVFHVATPMQHNIHSSKYKDTSEAAVGGVRSIVESCIKSGTVKRLIYTASVMSASPLKEDGIEFNDTIDESCWTPLNHSFSYSNNFTTDYIVSKTSAEKEALKYNDKEKYGLEVVTLFCGLVAGKTLLSNLSSSQQVLSLVTGNNIYYTSLRLLQQMLGSVPLIDIDDVCEAHVFCMENSSINGRYICATTYPTISQFAKGNGEEEGSGVKCGSKKLIEMGFEYKYDMKKTIDDTVNCARELGVLIN